MSNYSNEGGLCPAGAEGQGWKGTDVPVSRHLPGKLWVVMACPEINKYIETTI